VIGDPLDVTQVVRDPRLHVGRRGRVDASGGPGEQKKHGDERRPPRTHFDAVYRPAPRPPAFRVSAPA
jgi:hypothetical protein